MWQRVQTIYLTLSTLCLLGMLSLPFFKLNIINESKSLISIESDAFNTTSSTSDLDGLNLWNQFYAEFSDQLIGFGIPHILVLIFVILATLMCVIAISRFKKVKLQMKIGRINLLVILILFTVIGLNTYTSKGGLEDLLNKENLTYSTIEVEYAFGMFLPILALAFQFLANIGIKRDLNLVSTLDRLR